MDTVNKRDNRIRRAAGSSAQRLTALVMLVFMLVTVAALPESAYAASRKKARITYSVSIQNLNTDTVIKKGKKLKIKYKATQKEKGKVSIARAGFRSSNRKIATVSDRGVIKAKKKGTVSITVYCKSKPSKKKTVKIRVGTPVTTIRLSGQKHLCKGRSTKFRADLNSSATNKKVKWKSSDTSVATVSSSGKVRAQSAGTATIYAVSADGSGIRGSSKVFVHEYSVSDEKWVAHRGLHTYETENTAAAFRAAGEAGFWGCECDIWETRRQSPDIKLPKLPEDTDEQSGPADLDDQISSDGLAELAAAIEALPEEDTEELLDRADDVRSSWQMYEDLAEGLEEEELSALRAALVKGEGGEKTDLLEKLFAAYTRVYGYESLDLVINHDQTYNRIHGVSANVWDMTADEASREIPEICFLDEYMQICDHYGMVPVIEIKGTPGHCITDDGIRKMTGIIVDADGGRTDLLKRTHFISFDSDSLARTQAYCDAKYGIEPYTALLFSSNWGENIAIAANESFNAIAVKKELFSDDIYDMANMLGLRVGTWTYRDSASDEVYLHKHIQGGYDLDFMALDYKVFR